MNTIILVAVWSTLVGATASRLFYVLGKRAQRRLDDAELGRASGTIMEWVGRSSAAERARDAAYVLVHEWAAARNGDLALLEAAYHELQALQPPPPGKPDLRIVK